MAPPSNSTLHPRPLKTTPQDSDNGASSDIESEDSPPHKKTRRFKKQMVLLDDDTSSASDNDAATSMEDDPTSAIEDDLTRAWHTNLERLHHCTMSNKYAAAMSIENGDWNFDRDESLSSGSRPSPSSFKDFRWIDTKAPEFYVCLAIERNSSGTIVSHILEIECAWSVDGGLKARKWEHLDDKLSKEY
ncbi:hypothetical protein KCU90_g110, partial [Aureobasidium melanogenum]